MSTVFSTDNLPFLVNCAVGGGFVGGSSAAGGNKWVYNSTNPSTDVRESGFFTIGYDLGMRKFDALRIIDRGTTVVTENYVITASTSGPVTVTALTTE